MPLSLRERLTQTLMPAALYYRSRIADEATWGEHELDVLPEIMAPGGTAIDAGANQGVFAYAFSRIAAEVEAFEPNPDYARFAQRMLGTRARVHQLALSDKPGHAQFVVPLADDGTELHLGGMLSNERMYEPSRSTWKAVSWRCWPAAARPSCATARP